MERDPVNEADARLSAANLARVRRNYHEAIEQCLEVLREQPSNRAAHSLLGDIYRDQGQTEDARRWYRLALDLGGNESDRRKLEALAGEDVTASAPERVRVPLPEATAPGQEPAGTQPLAGVSPRRWLRGITAVSVGFLAIMVIWLALAQSHRRRESPVPRPLTLSPASATLLKRPATEGPSGGGDNNGGQPAPQEVVTGGSGFPPDSGTPHTANGGAHGGGTGQPNRTLPPAPVLSVRPLPAQSAPSEPAAGPVAGPPAGTALRVVDVRPDPPNGSAAVVVSGPPPSGEEPERRTAVLRSVFAAAQQVFADYTDVRRISVTVQYESAGSATPQVVLTGDIDRQAVQDADAANASGDTLAQRIQHANWGAV